MSSRNACPWLYLVKSAEFSLKVLIEESRQIQKVLFSQHCFQLKIIVRNAVGNMMLSLFLKDDSSVTPIFLKWVNSFSVHFMGICSALSSVESQNVRAGRDLGNHLTPHAPSIFL